MKLSQVFYLTILLGSILTLSSCNRSSNDVWEDTKTAGRHMQRGFGSLGGKQGNSRQVCSKDQFCSNEDENLLLNKGGSDAQNISCGDTASSFDLNDDFVAINDPEGTLQSREGGARPARETPGEDGSSIPGIESFRDPATNPQWAAVFNPIYFAYNCYLIKGEQNTEALHTIAAYLRNNPNLYVFVEGHADERGPQAYNLALSSKRANAVRDLLVSDGVNPDHLFTIAYGKERPVVLEHHEEAWSRNRRAEFKIYER